MNLIIMLNYLFSLNDNLFFILVSDFIRVEEISQEFFLLLVNFIL